MLVLYHNTRQWTAEVYQVLLEHVLYFWRPASNGNDIHLKRSNPDVIQLRTLKFCFVIDV